MATGHQMAAAKEEVWALDFDGVVVDSVGESSLSAWLVRVSLALSDCVENTLTVAPCQTSWMLVHPFSHSRHLNDSYERQSGKDATLVGIDDYGESRCCNRDAMSYCA